MEFTLLTLEFWVWLWSRICTVCIYMSDLWWRLESPCFWVCDLNDHNNIFSLFSVAKFGHWPMAHGIVSHWLGHFDNNNNNKNNMDMNYDLHMDRNLHSFHPNSPSFSSFSLSVCCFVQGVMMRMMTWLFIEESVALWREIYYAVN